VSKDSLVRGYAEALYAVAEAEGAIRDVEDELFAFAKAIERHSKLREALTDPALPSDRKQAVVHDILGERTHPQPPVLQLRPSPPVEHGQRHVVALALELPLDLLHEDP